MSGSPDILRGNITSRKASVRASRPSQNTSRVCHDSLEFDLKRRHYSFPTPPSRQLPQKSTSAFLEIQTHISRNPILSPVLALLGGRALYSKQKGFRPDFTPPWPQRPCGQINSCQPPSFPPTSSFHLTSSLWRV